MASCSFNPTTIQQITDNLTIRNINPPFSIPSYILSINIKIEQKILKCKQHFIIQWYLKLPCIKYGANTLLDLFIISN